MASFDQVFLNVIASHLPVLFAASGHEKKKICGAEQIAGTITYLMVQTPCLAMGEKVYILLFKWEVKMATTAKMLWRQTLISRILAQRHVTPRDPVTMDTLQRVLNAGSKNG